MIKIGVLNYGAGNLINVKRAIEFLGYRYILVSSSEHFSKIDGLIIPGVGAFPKAMENLKQANLINDIKTFANTRKPILGICLGMQLLFETGYEFKKTKGLGLIKGEVRSFPSKNNLGNDNKVPHIGWSKVIKNSSIQEQKIIKQIKDTNYFYFLHSFIAVPENKENILTLTDYNSNLFPSIVCSDNIIGCQFHPEKSGKSGLALLKSFLEID
ncbi:imidazole glycerol phosphate synthase subunit HisH [Pelagibacteraceae bacterium]|nr:imidazole glycerol phosphate synthase subunit HisH [Pelagibacteraceae bacterium]